MEMKNKDSKEWDIGKNGYLSLLHHIVRVGTRKTSTFQQVHDFCFSEKYKSHNIHMKSLRMEKVNWISKRHIN